MRILMAMAGLGGGGAERFFERLASGLNEAGHDIQILIRPVNSRVAHLKQRGIDVQCARFGGVADIETGFRVRSLIRKTKPDIVLSFMSRAASYIPMKAKPRHVARLGGYYPLKHYKSAAHLVANTRDIADWLVKQGATCGTVSYIPNFVETGKATAINRAELETPEDADLVLALGRLHPNKAFDTLIKAVAAKPNLWLWLGGDGPERNSLASLATRLGISERVRFLGWLENPGPFLAAADIIAVPSRHEPLGNLVLEGWSYAKPVIATASTGPANLIENGTTGRLVPVDDADRLGAALSETLAPPDRGAALGQAGLRILEDRFSPNRVIASYVELFARLGAKTTT